MQKTTEGINYFELYADVSNRGFQDTLCLDPLSLMLFQMLSKTAVDASKPLWIPPIAIEGLADTLGSPYKASAALYDLKKRRMIIPNKDGIGYYFNIEYPVLFYCMHEDDNGSRNLNQIALFLKKCHFAIEKNNLARVLLTLKRDSILNFLNYVQGIFNQPLTKVNPNVRILNKKYTPKKNGDDMPDGGRLANGDVEKGDSKKVQKKRKHSDSVQQDRRVAGGSRWEREEVRQMVDEVVGHYLFQPGTDSGT